VIGPVVDGVDQLVHRPERGAAEPAVGDLVEPQLDEVQPRARRRREVQMDPPVPGQPRPHVRVRVRRGVVHDHVHVTPAGHVGVNHLQERQELTVPVTALAQREHPPGGHVERRVEVGGAVPAVVIGHLAQRMVEVSVIGIDRFSAGQGAAKYAHEKAMLAGPIPVRVLRAAQFHEFVPQLIEWGTRGDVAYVRSQRIQPVAARAVAQALVDLATDPAWAASPARSEPPLPEIAGPRDENLVDIAKLFLARRGTSLRVQGVTDPSDPDDKIWVDGNLLAKPHAILAGPTFEAWLDPDDANTTTYGAR
jgi:hypothetical protein